MKESFQKYCLPHGTILSGFQWVNSWIYCKMGVLGSKRKARLSIWAYPEPFVGVEYSSFLFPHTFFSIWCHFLKTQGVNRVSVRLLGGWKKTAVSWLSPFCRTAVLVVRSAQEFPFVSVVSGFEWPDTLIIAKALGSRIASSNSASCLPFLTGCPEDVKNPLCFQSTPKSSAAPKVQRLWV